MALWLPRSWRGVRAAVPRLMDVGIRAAMRVVWTL